MIFLEFEVGGVSSGVSDEGVMRNFCPRFCSIRIADGAEKAADNIGWTKISTPFGHELEKNSS